MLISTLHVTCTSILQWRYELAIGLSQSHDNDQVSFSHVCFMMFTLVQTYWQTVQCLINFNYSNDYEWGFKYSKLTYKIKKIKGSEIWEFYSIQILQTQIFMWKDPALIIDQCLYVNFHKWLHKIITYNTNKIRLYKTTLNKIRQNNKTLTANHVRLIRGLLCSDSGLSQCHAIVLSKLIVVYNTDLIIFQKLDPWNLLSQLQENCFNVNRRW